MPLTSLVRAFVDVAALGDGAHDTMGLSRDLVPHPHKVTVPSVVNSGPDVKARVGSNQRLIDLDKVVVLHYQLKTVLVCALPAFLAVFEPGLRLLLHVVVVWHEVEELLHLAEESVLQWKLEPLIDRFA